MIYSTSPTYRTSNLMAGLSQRDTPTQDHILSWPVGENTTSFPDFDISFLKKKFHEIVMQLVDRGELQNLLVLYTRFNHISLEYNKMNFLPSQRTLLFVLNSLRFRKIRNWQTVVNLVYNLGAVNKETVKLRSRILSVIGELEKEKAKDEELNRWLIDLDEDDICH